MLYNMCRKCQRPTAYPNKYCKDCKLQGRAMEAANNRAANRRYNQTRDIKYTRFYKSVEWRKLSGAYMQHAQYKCEFKGSRCSTLATEVHHIKPIQSDKGWDQRLEWSNLMSVCVQCHNEIHRRFGGR